MEQERTHKASYLVEGMTCSGCEKAISSVVGNIEGVQSATADLSSSTLSVEYEPQKVDIGKIKSAVQSVGYKFVGERPPHGQRESSGKGIP